MQEAMGLISSLHKPYVTAHVANVHFGGGVRRSLKSGSSSVINQVQGQPVTRETAESPENPAVTEEV